MQLQLTAQQSVLFELKSLGWVEKVIFKVSNSLEKKVCYGLVCVLFGVVNSTRVG